ncbi:MAG: hypothetical protein EOO13_17925 [Chitinophagaceae bacterium]|nr:MAG: hypothetical protein EOO13_17925 [Chitinophagaceae bacterium]
MEAHNSEYAISQYWVKLTSAQQESVLSVVKNFVIANEGQTGAPTLAAEVMERIWKDREDYLNGIGKNYSREEARAYILRKQTK